MEQVMNPPRLCESKTRPSCLALGKDSRLVSKQAPPKVRIIHIFAPEIIKTDVANFRELVQRLTGKPIGRQGGKGSKKGIRKNRSKAGEGRREMIVSRCNSAESSDLGSGYKSATTSACSDRVKEEEEEMWGTSDHNSGFFAGFADFDGFIHGFTDQFPLAPNLMSSSHMDVFGGVHFS